MRRSYAVLASTVALASALAACTDADAPTPASPAPATSTPGGDACGDGLVDSSLPTWARAGFAPADQAVPHVVGDHGAIVGVVFGDPLSSPHAADHANKILWVARSGAEPRSPLTIEASLAGSDRTAERVLEGGPGPSYVDLPAAGCWTLDLSWSGHSDTVHLRYDHP